MAMLPNHGFLQEPSTEQHILATWNINPSERPSARKIVDVLSKRRYPLKYFCESCMKLELDKASSIPKSKLDDMVLVKKNFETGDSAVSTFKDGKPTTTRFPALEKA
ncbi:hypothetical protein E8E11_009875 [Didymella keratinophila]|nr:hypothetical protein E8E11_009875 [Didymella keratinophila]